MQRRNLAPSCTVAIVGDGMVDHYIWGKATRLSPEAPVPVVAVEGEELRPGGAANVAANVSAMGGVAKLLTFAGDDALGREFLKLVEARGALVIGPFLRKNPTTRKTRIVVQNQQVVRVDWEKVYPLAPEEEELIIAALEATKADVFVLSDYAKGVVTSNVARCCIEIGKKRGVPVVVDPKPQHRNFYRGATVMTPNRSEAEALVGSELAAIGDQAAAAMKLREMFELEALIMTLGEDGMILATSSGWHHFLARSREVFDVSGAGDTVVAAVALSLGSGWGWEASCELATVAAGLVVQKKGTSVVSWDEITGSPDWPFVELHLDRMKPKETRALRTSGK